MDYQRLKELADRSYNNGTFTFTDFCSMADLSAYYEKEKELRFAGPVLFGGCDIAERKMIRFGNPEELGYEQDFPITALIIRPAAAKFADDLNHRDFLGSLMNLGIKRELLGDIFVKEKAACVFCKDSIADYIIENLTRIKHTTVKVSVATEKDTAAITAPTLEEKVIQVASLRLDAVIARVYNLSRNDAVSLCASGLVFINGRECTENAKDLKPGDVISVRGHGKFEFADEIGASKKGKINCRVQIYR
ncbi:MAG: hypothetical protein K6E19_01055 [Lachnospiraceae bacterium]|nr:hypothetical protein [Lachnospiraceae bacterium]